MRKYELESRISVFYDPIENKTLSYIICMVYV